MEKLIELLAKALKDAGHEVDQGTDALGVDIDGVHYDINVVETE